MANDPVNQNNNSVNPPLDINKWAEQYQQGTLESQQYFQAAPELKTTGSAKTFAEITAQQQYDKIMEDLRQESVKEDYDNFFSGTKRFIGNILANAGAMVLDTLGALTDPADWRLPEVMAMSQEYDEDFSDPYYQSNPLGDEVKKATNNIFETLDDYTFLGDGDVTGNNWTKAAQATRNYAQNYFQINTTNDYFDTALNTTSMLIGSIGGGMIPGVGLAKLGQMAKLSQTANVLFNAFITTEATGLSIAQDVHDQVYGEVLHKLAPELQGIEESAGQQAFEKTLKENGNLRDAEWEKQKAIKAARDEFALLNPKLGAEATKNAAIGADVSMKAMAPAFLLNLITSNMFTRSLYSPKNILSKPTRISGLEMLKEGIPEAIEEGGIENIAEQMGIAYGTKGSYTSEDLSKIIWNSEKNTLNWDTIFAAGVGFIGGAGTATFTGLLDFGKRKKQYETQQTQIQKENRIGESAGIPERIAKATTLMNTLQEVTAMGKEAARLETEGHKEEANAIKSKMLSIQAYEAFTNGTTKNLIENYEKISNNPNASPEIQAKAREAIVEIKQLGEVFEKTKGKFINDSQVFGNRVNNLSLTRAENQLQNEIVQKRIEASKAVQSALEIGDATLKTLSKKENVLDEQGNIIGQKEVGGKELSYDLTKLDENPYTDTEERTVYDTFRSNVTENVQAVRELVDLENRYKQVKELKNQNEKSYNKITSKAYQKSIKQEQRLYEVFKAGQAELESLKGTDKFMPLVDAIMEKYKGKIIDSDFNRIRKTFELAHEKKIAAQEITKQEYIRDRYSDKTKESETMSNEDLANSEGKSPTSEPVAEQTMLDDVARKLAGGATMKTLSKAEQEFYINNSAQVDKRRAEIEGNAPVQETVETEEVNPELNKTGNQILDLVGESSGVNPNPVKPLSEGKVDKIVGEETKQVTLTPQEQSALNKIKGDQIQKPLFHRQLGTNFQTIVDSLIAKGAIKSEGNNYIKLEPSVTVTITTDNRTEAQIAADNFINSEFTYAGDEYQLIVQQSKDEEKNKKIKDAVDVIKDRIKNNVLSGWRVEEGKVGNKNIYKIFKPVTSGINAQPEEDVNYQPNELNENIPAQKLQELKDLVSDYVEIMEMESGNFPSFEELMKNFIKNVGRKQAEALIKVLGKGWELNNYGTITNYDALISKLFKDPKQIISDLMNLAPEISSEVTVSTTEESTVDLAQQVNSENNKVKEVPVAVTPENKTVYETTSDIGQDTRPKLGHSFSQANIKYTIEEQGEGVSVTTEFEELPTELKLTKLVKSAKLLDYDSYQPGTELEIVVPDQEILDFLVIPDRVEDPTSLLFGAVKTDENGKRKTIKFTDWVNSKTEEYAARGENFLNSQEYWDRIPMLVRDSNGDYVAYAHEPQWYNPTSFGGDIQQAQSNVREIRKAAKDAHQKGKAYKVVVSDNSGGLFPRESSNPVTIRNANPDAQVAYLRADANGAYNLYIDNKPVNLNVINLQPFISAQQQNINAKTIIALDIRRWGTDKDGNPTYKALYSISPKLNQEQSQTVTSLVLSNLILNNKNIQETSKGTFLNLQSQIKSIPNKEDGLKLDIKDRNQFERLLSNYVIFNYNPRLYSSAAKEDIKSKVASKDFAAAERTYTALQNTQTKGRPYMFYQDGYLVYGISGEKANILHSDMMSLDNGRIVLTPELEAKLEYLNQVLSKSQLSLSKQWTGPVVHVNNNFGLTTVANSYHDYLADNLTTKIKSINIGNENSPKYVTRIQPSIFFEPKGAISRNQGQESVSDNKVTEQDKQKISNVLESTTDEKLAEAIPELIQDGIEIFGNTIEEKVEDLKQVVQEMNNDSKEIVENYLEAEPEVDNIAEFTEFLKQSENQIKWVNEYFKNDYSEDVNYQPREIEDEDVKEMNINLMRIDGLSSRHQTQLANYVNIKLGDVLSTKRVNQKEIRDKVVEELNTLLGNNKQLLEDNLAKLKAIPNGDKIQQVSTLINKYQVALDKINLVLNNADVVYEQALALALKDLNGKIVDNKVEIKDNSDENDGDKQEGDDEPEFPEEEAGYIGTENYSKTSVEVNPKSSITSTLRRFMRDIPDVSVRTGLPKTGAMGTPLYVNFDTAFDTIMSILADAPVDYKQMLDILKLNQDKQPWIPAFIEKLENSSNEVKNQFTSTMGKHGLTMEFMMFSFSPQGVKLKVMNTNSFAIGNKVSRDWKNNLTSDSPLVNEFGEIQLDVVNELYDQYKSWLDAPADIKSEYARLLTPSVKANKLLIAPTEKTEKLVAALKTKDRRLVVDNTAYRVSLTQDGNISITPMGRNVMSSAIVNYTQLSLEEQQEALDITKNWLGAFGIEMTEDAIESIFKNGIYHQGKLVTPRNFFQKSDKTGGAIGLLANWLETTKSVSVTEDKPLVLDDDNNPLLQSAIENTLAVHQSRFSPGVVTPSFRDGKKSIYGFTAPKYITDRFKDLKTNPALRNQLRDLSFSKNSLWLQFFEDGKDLPNWSFRDTFNVSHLSLNAIKQYAKKIYGDNGITSLGDIDHELVKVGMFQDVKQGSFTQPFIAGNESISLRTARFFTPTNSDKTTMPLIKTMALKLNEKRLYDTNEDNKLVPNQSVTNLLFEQLVMPELERILNFTKNIGKTDIKNYDKGAQMFLLLPNLNNLVVGTTEDNIDITLRDILINKETELKNVLIEHKDLILKELQNYVRYLADEKLKVWESNGYYTVSESGNVTNKLLNSAYLNEIQATNEAEKIELAAMDYEINQMISNANAFMTFIGDPALYYKVDESQGPKSFIEKSEETFVNVGKRLAAMIAPGSKLADSENEQYTQIVLADRVALSENIEFLTELLDNKKFNWNKYNEIKNRKSPSEDPKIVKEFEAKREADMKAFYAEYPNSNGYFDIEGTNAQEYTTWQEHMHILEKLGRLSDVAVNITPEEIRQAKEMFASGTPKSQLTEAQKEILKKVLQPIKPVYTGQVFDKKQDVMRMVYIKSSSFPLIPQLTEGTELDKLAKALEELQKEGAGNNPSPYKYVRASYQTANKVGSKTKGLDIFNGDGSIKEISTDDLKSHSLILNRKDFKIQLDVPYKSLKRDEDTISNTTQLMKLLFGNGMMELDGFMYDGKSLTGTELEEEFTKSFIELSNLKKQQLYDELGIDIKTGKPTNVYETAAKLQKILKTEAVNRGYSRQVIESLELEVKNINGEDDISFKMPIWLTANSDRFESLLNAIVNNRIVKLKLPGNSYIAGSEEGFKVQTNFKNIDKSKIVWTSKWNNNSLQGAKYDKDGNLKFAQVIAPSKFRKKDGTLIDLLERRKGEYVYVTKTSTGFRLKEDMIDSELLNITSLRIPTSGHKSGSQIEIVGFLTQEQGDLMIVPRNFTKQKGLDFDVDKENTYQLWHETDENGKITVMKEGDEEKLLHNKIVKTYSAVFSNPSKEVQRKINGILSIDYAKEQAELIDSWTNKTKDNTYFTPLSSEYQKNKMFLGASGKVGTGAYSLDVTSQSLFEQAKIKGTQLEARAIVGKDPLTGRDITEKYRVRFGNEKESTGNLGESKTLEGSRTIAEVLEELQNIAVDNEKEQVMGRVTLTSFTLDASKAMVFLGFDKSENESKNSIPFLLLSQPIIVEYSKEMANANSNVISSYGDKEQAVINKLLNKYGGKDYVLGYRKDVENNDILSALQLEQQLKSVEVDNALQLAALNRFLELKKIGEALRGVQTSINTDSKGLSKSIPENIEKINTITKLANNPIITNADKLLGDFIPRGSVDKSAKQDLLNRGYIEFGDSLFKPTTISGIFTANALSTANSLWSKHFPYNSKVITTVTDQILPLISKGEASETSKAEKRNIIIKEIKKYLNSIVASETLFENVDAQAERYRLFFDEADGKQSLASYVKDLMRSGSSLKSNALLQKLDFDINKNGQPSLLMFNNTASGSYDEDGLNNALLELMELNLNLKTFNGEPYTSRMLAQDLISYSYLEGGVQEAIQFAKFVPIKYLDKMAFSFNMSEIDFNSDKVLARFGINPDKPESISGFTIQFAQNNADLLPKLQSIPGVQITAVAKEGLLDKDSFTMEELLSVGSAIEMAEDEQIKESLQKALDTRIETTVGPDFVTYKDEDGNQMLWMKNGDTYFKIPTAGKFGMAEYNNNIGPVKSLVSKVNPINPFDAQDSLPPLTDDGKSMKQQRFGLGGQDTLTDIIAKVASSTTIDPYLSNLAKQLLPNVDPSTTITVMEMADKGSYNRNTNAISISLGQAQDASDTELARTILKELVHSIADNEIAKHVDANNNLRTSNAPSHILALVKLFNQVSKSPDFVKAIDVIRQKRAAKKALTREEARVFYGGLNVYEFVEMMMTQPEFQQEMAKTKVQGGGTLLDLFRNFVTNLFKNLGVEFKGDTVAAQAIENIFIMIDEKGKVKKETKPEVKIEVQPITQPEMPYDTSKFKIYENKETGVFEILADDGSTLDEVYTLDEAKKSLKASVDYFNNINKQITTPPTVSNPVKNDLLKVLEEIQDDINNDVVVDFVDVNFNDFRGYPNVQEYFNNPYGVESREYEFIKANKDTVEELLKTLPEKDAMSLMNKLKSETDKSDTGASSTIGSILTTDTSKEQELLNQANKALKNTKYELFPDVFANEEQTKALDNLDTFVKAPRDKSEKYQSTFVLVGAAGTGKTTIVKKILELNPNKKVVGAAVSNAAKNVLNNSLRKGNVTTIASLVGYKENRATGKYELDPKFELAKSPIKKAEILIIDETSMISKEMMAAIYNLAPANCKIIFMGDNKQLPPIGEKDDSQTFNAATKPEYNAKLTQRMRQDEDSPIIGLSDIIGANIEKALNEIKRRVISRRISDFNPITNKGLLFAGVNEFYSELKKDLLADIQNTKIIGYTNALRETMNNTARELIWGEQGAKNEYNIGEILVANDLKYDRGIINGEYYKVTSVTPSPTAVNIEVLNVVNGQARISPMSFPGYRLAVEVISDGDNFGKTIYLNLPTKESKTAIDRYQKSYADNKQWGIFYRNRDVLFDVDYGYAITSHKAQGSTINNAYVMEDDIVDSQMSNKEVNQSLNVAVTRPRNKAVIYSQYNKPTSEEKLSAEEISRMESTGESFQPREEPVSIQARTKALLVKKGVIDQYYNVKNIGQFRTEAFKLRDEMKSYFPDFNDKLFVENKTGTKVYPNEEAFKKLNQMFKVREAVASKREIQSNQQQARLQQMRDAKRAETPYTDEYLFSQSETSERKTIGGKARETYFKDSDTKKSSEVVSAIANSNHPLNKLAKKLLPFIKENDVTISLVDKPYKFKITTGEEVTAAGYYISSENKIELLNSGNKNLEKLILHEVLHSISSHQLRENTATNDDFNKLYQYAKENLPQSYELENVSEFLVGIFTDSRFMRELQKVPAIEMKKYNNFLEEVLDHLLSYLGFKKGTSLYEQAFAVATNILEESREFSKMANEYAQYGEQVIYSAKDSKQTQKDVVSSAIENQIDELIRKGIIKAKCD